MAHRSYNPKRDITPEYLSTVEGWIARTGEVLVVMRYLCGGGAKDFALVRSNEEFRELVRVVPEGTDIIVFRDRQLPIRGVVTEEFIARAKALIPEDSEYMFVCMKSKKADDSRCFGDFDYHRALEASLRECAGEEVAAGLCPDFMGRDSDAMVSASKGGIDGPR